MSKVNASGSPAISPSTIVLDKYHYTGYAILWNAVTTANWVFTRRTETGVREKNIRATDPSSYPLIYRFHTEDGAVYTAEVGRVSHALSNEVGLKCRILLFERAVRKTKSILLAETREEWRKHEDLAQADDSLLEQLVKQVPKQPMYVYPAAIQSQIKVYAPEGVDKVDFTQPVELATYPITAFFLTEFNPYKTKETPTDD